MRIFKSISLCIYNWFSSSVISYINVVIRMSLIEDEGILYGFF